MHVIVTHGRKLNGALNFVRFSHHGLTDGRTTFHGNTALCVASRSNKANKEMKNFVQYAVFLLGKVYRKRLIEHVNTESYHNEYEVDGTAPVVWSSRLPAKPGSLAVYQISAST